MAAWHNRFNGHGFGWTLGVGDGQGGLACCNSWELSPNDCKGKQKFNFPIIFNTPVNYYQVEMHVIKVGGRRDLNYDKTHAC